MAENMFSELSRIIDQVGKDKGIDKEIVIEAVTEGMLVAARKKWGTYREIEAQYNEESGDVELYQFREVVEDKDFVDEEVEIKLTEALELDPDAQVNESVGIKLETDGLGRIAAQIAKQTITQRVRDAEREIIFNEFEERRGEIASGIARRVERGAIVVDMGRTEAYIPPREQIPGEQYKPGDRIQGYIADVRQTTRGPQIIMSRADSRYLMKLFEIEVPEIYDGIVKLEAAAREPGQRAKVAVSTTDPSVDPVGACVGMKGSRVQNIVQELRGEKIDIVPFDAEPTRFVCNALAPAEISKVFVDDENQSMEVVVPDSQLSLAIGRKGQNVRLAAKLSGWRLDISSEQAAAQKTAQAIFNLMLLPGMTDTMAQNIYQSGFNSFKDIADAEIDDLMLIPGYETDEAAQKLSDTAIELVEQYQAEGKEIPVMPVAAAPKTEAAGTSGGSKESAEEALKREMAELNAEEAPVEEPAAEEATEAAQVEEPATEEATEEVEAASAEEAPVEESTEEEATEEEKTTQE